MEAGAFLAGMSFSEIDTLNSAFSSIQVLQHLFGSIFFASIGMIVSPVSTTFSKENAPELPDILLYMFLIHVLL